MTSGARLDLKSRVSESKSGDRHDRREFRPSFQSKPFFRARTSPPRVFAVSRKDSADSLAVLLNACSKFDFEPHDIARNLDARGHYEVTLTDEFPLLIKLFHYTSKRHTRGATWHERLELFTPLDGPTRFRMGDQEVALDAGDVLVVDNLKLHHVVDFPSFDTRVIVVSFQPEFVYSLGSPSHDYAFLLPFYTSGAGRSHVLKRTAAVSGDVHQAMAKLLDCYFARRDRQFFEAGCKAFLLEMLYHLARHFRSSELVKWEFMRQQQRSLRLKKLFDHVNANYSEKLSVTQAAKMVGMSPAQFMKTFKTVAGMTLVSYLNHVRVANGARLLKETDWTVAEVAGEVGFSDQSYFDKRFKRAFGQSPREFRARMLGGSK